MTVSRLKDVVTSCYENGQYTMSGFRKVPALTSAAGIWSDLTMAPGNPKPNYYTGTELRSTVLDARSGLFHGESVSPKQKFLHKITIGGYGSANQVGTYILCDFLMFYPLVNMDSTGEQTLTTITTLPRYTTGDGVRAALVATNPFIGGAQFNITFTDSSGASAESFVHTSNTGANIGSIVNSNVGGTGTYGPFIQVPASCQGIRSVNSIEFYGPNGGLASLVLVKPLATLTINEVSATAEFDFLLDRPTMPRIYEGAVLGFLFCPAGSVAALQYSGVISTIWN